MGWLRKLDVYMDDDDAFLYQELCEKVLPDEAKNGVKKMSWSVLQTQIAIMSMV